MAIVVMDGYSAAASSSPMGTMDNIRSRGALHSKPWLPERSGSQSAGFSPIGYMTRFLTFHSSATANLLRELNLPDSLISPQDQLSSIKKQGGFSVSQLAQILDVSRPTIYSWNKGSAIQEENSARISNLYFSLRKIEPNLAGQLSNLCNYRLASGMSVILALAKIANDQITAEEVLEELKPKLRDWMNRRSKAERLAGAPQSLLSKSDLSASIKTSG